MLAKIKGQLVFYYSCPQPKKKYNKYLFGSLLGILIGVFLLPLSAYFSDITSEKIIELTNIERIKSGQKSLTANQLLTQAAYKKGQAILEAQTFKHNFNDKKFSQWIIDSGYKYSYVGENLAIDFINSKNLINAWLDSETHKRNLLNPYYTEIGIAIIEGKFLNQDSILVVQIFGAPPRNIAQPSLMGINNHSNFNNFNFTPLANNNLTNQNLLTHSLVYSNLNNNLTLTNNNLNNYMIKDQTQVASKLNKFFAQYDFAMIKSISSIVLSSLLLAFITYVYFLSFAYMAKRI